jgi:hypothetical protein
MKDYRFRFNLFYLAIAVASTCVAPIQGNVPIPSDEDFLIT